DGSTTAKEKGRVEHFGITLEKEEEGKHDASAHQNMAKIKYPNEDQRPTKGASTSGPIKEDDTQSISSDRRSNEDDWDEFLCLPSSSSNCLYYPHTGTGVQSRVIHRDVKSSNVFLDDKLTGKIFDFRVSIISPTNQLGNANGYTGLIRGTFGYVDAEPALNLTLDEQQHSLDGPNTTLKKPGHYGVRRALMIRRQWNNHIIENARSLLSTKSPSKFKLFSNVGELVSIRNAMRSRIQAACDPQKSYADVSHKPLKFQVGDKVKLKSSSWKEVIRFGKRGKLNLSTFHVSNLKKCFFDESLVIPLDEIQIDNNLYFVDEPVKILDREFCKDTAAIDSVPVATTRDYGRPLPDTIQLETTVTTISQEYLLEFTSMYGILEALHLELPCPEDRIVDFPEGKVDMDLFSLIRAPNRTKVKTSTRPRAAHEVPLLTVTASRTTTGVAPEVGQVEGIAATGPHVVKERRKRGNDRVDTNAPPKVLMIDQVDPRPTESTQGRKSLAAIELGMGSSHPVPASQGAPMDVSDPDLLSFTDPQSRPSVDVTHGNGVAMGSRFEQEAKLLKKSVAQVARQDKRIQARENEIKNLETLLEAESDIKKAAEGRREEKLKAAFEEFKQYEDNQVEQRCAEIDARLDALSLDFDEELYPHMLTTIVGRRWEIGHGLRLAVMKCGESTELRQAVTDIVSAGIANGMSEGCKNGVKHEKAKLSLEAIEAYDPEAEAKYITALHALKDLKYPIVDKLGSLKDAPMDVIMASLHLKSDTGDDAPQ
nr:putative reverse transcriptase domain-containing protein [Tanacetum cinerariifolium]